MTLVWSPDPGRVVLPGDPPVEVRDAYSQWVFGAGHAFLPASRLTKEHPDDFGYYLISTARRPISGPHPVGELDETELASFGALAGEAPHRSRQMVGLLPIRASAVPESWRPPDDPEAPDPGIDPADLVIAGVIDDGVNIFHQRFQTAEGSSRIDYAWVQGARAQADGTVPFGREITGAQIAAARATGASEPALMERFGLRPGPGDPYMPSTFASGASHGTQITDLVAGADPADTDARATRLITVQFPSLAVVDTSGASLVSSIQMAAVYVFDRAFRLSQRYGLPIPVVLNLSFGLTGGARTGGHILERTLRAQAMRYRKACRDRFGRPAPSARVLPAGNFALMRGHAEALAGLWSELSFDLVIQPDDQTPSYLEIWLPRGAGAATVTVAVPGDEPVPMSFPDLDERHPDRAERAFVLTRDDGPVLARLSLDAPLHDLPGQDAEGQSWWRLLLAIAPTRHLPDRQRAAPFGAWTIAVETASAPGPIRAWVQRDQDVSGLSVGARQPYLDDANAHAEAFDHWGDLAVDDPATRRSTIARNGTLSGLATSAPLTHRPGDDDDLDGPQLDAVAVGAIRADTRAAALYTSAARRGDPLGQAAASMGVAEASRVLPHIRAAGPVSGAGSALNGTSAAAAVVSRRMIGVMRALDPEDYADFTPATAIPGTQPTRGDGPDLASEPRIRTERLRDGGLLADLPPDLQAQATRGVRAKTAP